MRVKLERNIASNELIESGKYQYIHIISLPELDFFIDYTTISEKIYQNETITHIQMIFLNVSFLGCLK